MIITVGLQNRTVNANKTLHNVQFYLLYGFNHDILYIGGVYYEQRKFNKCNSKRENRFG